MGNCTFLLLTNNFTLPSSQIALIYRYRWMIELLFKQIKQNFPLRYFCGNSENAIKFHRIVNPLYLRIDIGNVEPVVLQENDDSVKEINLTESIILYLINPNAFFTKAISDLSISISVLCLLITDCCSWIAFIAITIILL